MMRLTEVLVAALAAALIFAAAVIGCGSVQEAHDRAPRHHYIAERETVF